MAAIVGERPALAFSSPLIKLSSLGNRPWIVPIPGTTKLHRLAENLGAASVELTPGDLREINSASDKMTLEGARYPEHLQKLVGR